MTRQTCPWTSGQETSCNATCHQYATHSALRETRESGGTQKVSCSVQLYVGEAERKETFKRHEKTITQTTE